MIAPCCLLRRSRSPFPSLIVQLSFLPALLLFSLHVWNLRLRWPSRPGAHHHGRIEISRISWIRLGWNRHCAGWQPFGAPLFGKTEKPGRLVEQRPRYGAVRHRAHAMGDAWTAD